LSGVIPTDHSILMVAADLKPPPPGSGFLDLTSDPPKAAVRIAGQPRGDLPAQISVPAGSVVVEASLPWPFNTNLTQTLTVAKDQKVPFAFRFAHGVYVVETNDPPEVLIAIDGHVIGNSPTNFALPPGDHVVVMSAPGYETATNRITIADNVSLTNRPALKALDGFVDWTSDPPGAVLTAEGNPTNKVVTNVTARSSARMALPPGSYKLTAAYSNLKPIGEGVTLKINAGMSTNVGKFTFEYGTVVFDSIRPAELSTNILVKAGPRDVPWGSTIYQKPDEPVNYVFSVPKYETRETNVVVTTGGSVHPQIVLARLRAPVNLISAPEGARYFTRDLIELKPDAGSRFRLPWGQTEIVARLGRLAAQTQALEVVLEKTNGLSYTFSNFGRLVLTNLPQDCVVYAGGQVVGGYKDGSVYEPLANNVTYEVRRGPRVENVTTNLHEGNNWLQAFLVKYYTNILGMEMVWVSGLPGTVDGGYVSKFEVTQKQYQDIMAVNPSSSLALAPKLPVNNLTVADMDKFCVSLSSRDRSNPEFPPDSRDFVYSLPTEAQWQFFAIGATTNGAIMSRGLEKRNQPEPVGNRLASANRYELQDLIGNVGEVCHADDGKAYYMGGHYAISIGRFASLFDGTGKYQRFDFAPAPQIGFRVVLVPPAAASSR
jgi:hypothetical protein